jgi:hypothetical protein
MINVFAIVLGYLVKSYCSSGIGHCHTMKKIIHKVTVYQANIATTLTLKEEY